MTEENIVEIIWQLNAIRIILLLILTGKAINFVIDTFSSKEWNNK